MTHPGHHSTPRLSYLPVEAWGEGVLLALLNLEDAGDRFPFKASRFVLQPGSTSPVDEHSVPELWLIASGSGRLVYDGSTYEMTAGDVFYMDSGIQHQAINTSTQALEIFSVWWPR